MSCKGGGHGLGNIMDVSGWLKGKKIAVVFGGRSAEREISILSGKAVLKALKNMGVNAVGIDADSSLPQKLKSKKIDFVYNVLHGPWGEDGTVQGMLEIMNIPYSGCGVLSSALAMDKEYSKRIFQHCGIPTPGFVIVEKDSVVPAIPALPVVVKPVSQGSAIGVSIVESKKGLAAALKEAFKFGDKVIVEQFIKGTEITVGVLGGKALPAVEIVPANKFYDFDAKYTKGKSKHIIPPRLSAGVMKNAEKAALDTFKALGCRAVSRIDIIVDKDGKPWVLEANTNPGMTETSLLPDEARAAGMDFGELILEIIRYSVLVI
jgi:D-alanine-D-alanine ligase